MRSYAMMIFMLWLEVLAISVLLLGILLGTIGAMNYTRNHNDERRFAPWKTVCLVRNYTSHRCNHRWFSVCYDRQPCFNEEYLVDYQIFNKTIIRSSIAMKNQKYLHRKLNATCYYNGRNDLTSVKWNYADKRPGLILFCIGYGIVGIVLPIMIILLVCLIIESRRYRQRRNSSEDLYTFHETILNTPSEMIKNE